MRTLGELVDTPCTGESILSLPTVVEIGCRLWGAEGPSEDELRR